MRKQRYEHYIASVMCSNCRMEARIKIPVDTSIDLFPCPKCGLRELHHPGYFGKLP